VSSVAEAAYLWGRHGNLIGIHRELPTVVRESSLVTIRPQDLSERIDNTVEGLHEAIERFQFTKRERLVAKLSRSYRSRLNLKTQEPATSLERSISQAVRSALIDLASETPDILNSFIYPDLMSLQDAE
jgi:hypothetical protein